jgi:hypothetical protein
VTVEELEEKRACAKFCCILGKDFTETFEKAYF